MSKSEKKHPYFSPTTPISRDKDETGDIEEQKQKTNRFCTVWQQEYETSNVEKNGKKEEKTSLFTVW